MITIRSAHEHDLVQMHQVFYQNEMQGVSSPPPPGDVASALRHILQTGTISVAEQEGQILADVPGPHPCLAPLLDRGFRIVYVELFVSTAPRPSLMHAATSRRDRTCSDPTRLLAPAALA